MKEREEMDKNRKELVASEPLLEGETIYLEGLSRKHVCQRYADWLNDKQVCRENTHGRVYNTVERTRDYVESVDNAGDVAAFAIVTKKENKHIGNISLAKISWENNCGEIAILIGDKDFWGKGVATQAYRLVIDYGFNMLNLHRLYSGMTVRNEAMIKVAQKAGMEKEAVLREAFFKEGKYVDVVTYAIINPNHTKEAEGSTRMKAPTNKKIVCTIEARFASTRLPGKTLLEICGKPTLELIIERLKRSRFIDEIVVATTVNADCLPIEKLAGSLGVGCFRGSEEDVLDRVLQAARHYKGDIIVEITGDETLIDPKIVDEVIDFYLRNDFDYVSNILNRRYPRGLDTQVFASSVLEEVSKITSDPADRENVSLYIYEHPEKYSLGGLPAPQELNHPDWRWTLDTKEDFEFLKAVYEALYPFKKDFDSYDVLEFLKRNPHVLEINRQVNQKAVR